MTTFVNCTPHALTVEGLGTLPASGIVARCATMRIFEAPIVVQEAPVKFGIRLVRQAVGHVRPARCR